MRVVIESPPQFVWAVHGSPVVGGCVKATGRCYVCGAQMLRAKLVSDWLGTNNTDQNRARNPEGTYVCEACVYVHSRTSPVLGRDAKEGKKFGGNFRNYSHLYDERGYQNASKGEKPLIREFLAREHVGNWFAAIADSGQKHVLPFAPINGPGVRGAARFEERMIIVPSDQSLIATMADLLTLGATKEGIESANYGSAWTRCGKSILEFERAHASERSGGWFVLALWLAQRNEERVQSRIEEEHVKRTAKRAVANADRRSRVSGSFGVPGKRARKPAQTLGPDRGAGKSGGENERQRGRVADKRVSKPEVIGNR